MPPFLLDGLDALGDWPGAVLLRGSTGVYATLNALHILAIGLLLGSVATLDLRLLGLFRSAPLAALAPPLARVAALGLGLAVLTGFLLFSVRPLAYATNPAFFLKLALVALGTLNALALRRDPGWMRGGAVGPWVRAGALLSLLTWVAAVNAGRWIGFLQ